MLPSKKIKPGVRLDECLFDAQFIGDVPPVVSCCSDSREVRPGDLFVALTGVHHDGHDHYREAVDRGAVAILADRVLPAGVPICLVPDVRVAYGQVCQRLAGEPSTRMKLVGVTGTNGKTTTTALVAGVLSAQGHRTGTIGTLGIYDGFDVSPATHTTPPAAVLANRLSKMVANDCTHVAMEVSSHALSQHRVAGMQFDVAVLTNIGRDHLDYHNTPRKYRLAKARLLDHLSPAGVVVANADDPECMQIVADCHHPVLTYGMQNEAEIKAELIERSASEQVFYLTAGSDMAVVRTQMIGDHHIYNCLAAATVGLAQGVDLNTAIRGLESVAQVPGRMQRIECGQPFSVFVDYAHSPDALSAVLETAREVTSGTLCCVFGAGGDRDRDKRPLMAQAVEAWADRAVVTSDNPRNEDAAQIAADICGGFSRPGFAQQSLDRAQAIRWALDQAEPGDCVVIAGKGHEDYQQIGKRRFYFDDCEVVRDCLYRREPEDSPMWALS